MPHHKTIIHALIKTYGPHPMIYGDGFAAEATEESYQASIGTARYYIQYLSKPDQALIFANNPTQLFGFQN